MHIDILKKGGWGVKFEYGEFFSILMYRVDLYLLNGYILSVHTKRHSWFMSMSTQFKNMCIWMSICEM